MQVQFVILQCHIFQWAEWLKDEAYFDHMRYVDRSIENYDNEWARIWKHQVKFFNSFDTVKTLPIVYQLYQYWLNL